ncbi:hypothetical protein G7Y89_g12399 [Cudoniella acicularis]|uniref:FAD-binding domain-containing protein n=1 Tax=Cudoniella acicularis TaxID=354080 RepID=A0A8H4VX00_9HELO|nr:hypothetical protein G7Y89_g12399 [Cudoniella acicularis]
MPYFTPLPTRDERCFTRPPAEAPVLIVGAGPAGLFAAYLLAKQALRTVIVERHTVRLGQPKAHAINPRSLEIFRQCGLDTQKLRALGSSAEDAFWVRFMCGLRGTALGALPYERQDEAVKQLTPEPLFNIPQPVLESFLQEAALETGLVTIHRGWKWEEASSDARGWKLSLVRSVAEPKDSLEIASMFIIAADGVESTVRAKSPSIHWDFPAGALTQKNFYCSIHAHGNIRPVISSTGNFAQLYFCVHPEHRSGLIVYDLSGSWVHTRAIDPETEDVKAFTEEKCRQLIDECLGPGVDYTVQSANMWYTWPRVASAYHTDDLRTFLTGDAAHAFPPQGGLGVNTGLADVHNLVWKLGYVIDGKVPNPQAFLKSYTLERKPVAMANALQSATNEKKWKDFIALSGDLVTASAEYEKGAHEFFQEQHVKEALDGSIAENCKPHFDSLGLQLGYVYEESMATEPPRECWDYTPSSRHGARLPHAWTDSNSSTLDFIPYNNFCLIHAGGPFKQRQYQVEGSTVEVEIVDIAGKAELSGWVDLIRLYKDTAILVRPDQHILGHVNSDGHVQALLQGYFCGGKRAGS